MKKIITLTVCAVIAAASLAAKKYEGIYSFALGGTFNKTNLKDSSVKTKSADLVVNAKWVPRTGNLTFKALVDVGAVFGKEEEVFLSGENDDVYGTSFSFCGGVGWNLINNMRNTLGIYSIFGFIDQTYSKNIQEKNRYGYTITNVDYTATYITFLAGLDLDYNFKITRKVGITAGCCFAIPVFGQAEFELKNKYSGNTYKTQKDIHAGGYSITPRIGISFAP